MAHFLALYFPPGANKEENEGKKKFPGELLFGVNLYYSIIKPNNKDCKIVKANTKSNESVNLQEDHLLLLRIIANSGY